MLRRAHQHKQLYKSGASKPKTVNGCEFWRTTRWAKEKLSTLPDKVSTLYNKLQLWLPFKYRLKSVNAAYCIDASD